jgi:hypothetical protein
MRRPRLLVDVREDDNLRGFHVLASLMLIAERLREVELYRLGGAAAEEAIACQAFAFDTGLTFRRLWRLPLKDTQFDLYVSAANVLPRDPKSLAGRRTARYSIVGLMFGRQDIFVGRTDIVDGANTAGIARAVAARLFDAADAAPALSAAS